MLSQEQYHMVEHSFKHSNALVFQVEDRVFVTEKIVYHRNKTMTFKDCIEVDITCFENNGTEYYGDCLNTPLRNITVKDPNPKGTKNSWWIASKYYKEDVIKGVKF